MNMPGRALQGSRKKQLKKLDSLAGKNNSNSWQSFDYVFGCCVCLLCVLHPPGGHQMAFCVLRLVRQAQRGDN